MGVRLPYTPRSKIKRILSQLFLRSRERAARLKMDKYCCQDCGIKQSKAKGRVVKVEVHHREGVLNWDQLLNEIYKYLLCLPEFLITLCVSCHEKHTAEQAAEREANKTDF